MIELTGQSLANILGVLGFGVSAVLAWEKFGSRRKDGKIDQLTELIDACEALKAEAINYFGTPSCVEKDCQAERKIIDLMEDLRVRRDMYHEIFESAAGTDLDEPLSLIQEEVTGGYFQSKRSLAKGLIGPPLSTADQLNELAAQRGGCSGRIQQLITNCRRRRDELRGRRKRS